MIVSGLQFTKNIINQIDGIVKASPTISRWELSRRLCQENNWHSANGRLKDMSCRKALVDLDRRGIISLPEVKTGFTFERAAAHVAIEIPPINCALPALGQVTVQPVSNRFTDDAKVWRSLLDTYHYLKSGPLCGAQIRYLVECANYGYIGALAFTSASFALKARDEYIGWTEAARRANLDKVVCNARLLIATSVQVPNLASHVLSLALARLPADWEERHGIRPALVETFVDPSRFDGTCYKAANWEYVGETAGRRDGVKKRIFVRQLCDEWRAKLCQAPAVTLGEMPRPEEPTSWAEEEFGTARIFDERLKQRLYVIADDFYKKPMATVPEACGCQAGTKAAYRFFNNKAVNMDVVITAHSETTAERCKHEKVVLAPQDTTTLDYNTHYQTEGFGPTGANGGIGLLLHDTMAFTVAGTPLGILDAQCWARDPDNRDDGPILVEAKAPFYTGPSLPGGFEWYIGYREKTIDEKESGKWLRSFRKVAAIQKLCPDTMFVSIGDRESDIWEVFLEALKDPNGPKLLVRSDSYKSRKVEDEYLWDFMATRSVAATLEIHVPRSGSQKGRDACCDLRFAQVEVSPPQNHTSDPPITLWAVYLLEDDPEDDVAEPLEWLLLTTVPVENVDDAVTILEWYQKRWGIEVFHRTLKSGCRIRDRQFGTADTLEACLGVDMVVAWRIFHLTMLGRETPDVPCTVFFNDDEWKTLCCLVTKNPVPPAMSPTMVDAIRMVGQLGGHLGRKGDGFPGTQVLWKGLQHLENAVEMAVLYGLYSKPRQRSP